MMYDGHSAAHAVTAVSITNSSVIAARARKECLFVSILFMILFLNLRAKVRIIFVIPTYNPVKSGKLTQNQALTPKQKKILTEVRGVKELRS